MRRNRAYRRYKSITKAKRKRQIDKDCSGWSYINGWVPYYDNLHQYSKNKVHCSCPDCSPKTRNKGSKRKRKNYAPALNYKKSEIKRIIDMDEQLRELGFDVPAHQIKNY